MNDFSSMVSSQVYFGADSVAAGLSEYRHEFDMIAISDERDRTVNTSDWIRENQFFILIHRETWEIVGCSYDLRE